MVPSNLQEFIPENVLSLCWFTTQFTHVSLPSSLTYEGGIRAAKTPKLGPQSFPLGEHPATLLRPYPATSLRRRHAGRA